MIVAEGRDRGRIRGLELASMGPQLDSCGRVAASDYLKDADGVLQWGRNLIVAEGGLPRAPQPQPRRFNGAAT